ncbi:MAG: aldehyde ferredoxin oxidoreductase family protein [Thermodesulfobacteriota bacterium]
MKARYGHMGKLLFVDLTNRKTREEELTEEMARSYIGGYGLGARVLMERMKTGADPLGPDNILGIGTGPLTGSGVVSTSRFTTMGKSPLTGYWGDANCGGDMAAAIKAAGYDAIFFEGKADAPVYLYCTDEKVEFRKADHLWGKNAAETETLIRSENGDQKLKVACIGMGGERLSRIAAIMNDSGRAAGRSGLGAVMGSKNLKALVCKGSHKPAIFDSEKVKGLTKRMLQEAKDSPSPLYSVLSYSGTPGAMLPHLAMHGAPIKNWAGNNIEDFPEPKWGNLAYEVMEKFVTKKYACLGCPIACGAIMNVPGGPYAVHNGHKPEYETVAAFGSLCLNDDMQSIIYANDLCNLHGLDTISAGAVIAFAIECYENGILTKSDTDGIELTWGNSEAIVSVLEKMIRREGIGDILAEGARIAAPKIGRGAEQFAMHIGGEMVAMHDPRESPGWGATYVADASPGRHTRGGTYDVEMAWPKDPILYGLGLPKSMDKYNPEGKGEAHAILASFRHLINASGACMFAVDGLNFPLMDITSAVTGWDLTPEEFIKAGYRIATLQQAFNVREGFKPSDFTMPPRIEGKPPFKVGVFKDLTLDMEDLKKRFYDAMGFDYQTGAVKRERIAELGLEGVMP